VSDFLKPKGDAARLATAVVGAYLVVACSDGDYAKSEEIRLRLGQFDTTNLPGLERDVFEAIYPDAQAIFLQDYDKAEKYTLSLLTGFASEGLVRRAVAEAVRVAVMADQQIKPQENLAINRIEEALGLPPGQI
jgi:tellurite resistance protein